MKKLIRILVVICFIALSGNNLIAQKSYKSLKFQVYDPEISSADLTKGMTYDKKTGILYKISNNHEIVAIDLVINEEMTQRKILFFGSTVWIDTLGKSKQKLGVMFPIGRKEFAGMNQTNKRPEQATGDMKERMKTMAEKMKTVELIGVSEGKENDSLNSLVEDDIIAKTEISALGIMYYHLEFPFSRLGLSFDHIKHNNISIAFETGYLDLSQMQGGGMRPGGGRPPGGMQPGNNSGNNDERKAMMEAMMQADAVKIKGVKLFIQK